MAIAPPVVADDAADATIGNGGERRRSEEGEEPERPTEPMMPMRRRKAGIATTTMPTTTPTERRPTTGRPPSARDDRATLTTMIEIRSRRDDLARGIAKKALIKGTLITAIDDNLVKSIREMDGTTTYDDGSSRWASRLLRPGWNFNPLAFLLAASASMMRVATWRAHSHCQGCSRTIG